MKLLKKSFKTINSIKYKTYKKAKTILFDVSALNSPMAIPYTIFITSFFKEEGFNIHAFGSSLKVEIYKYVDTTTDKFIPFKSYISVIKYLPKIIYLHLLNFKKYKNMDEIFLLEINGVYMGDAIYDEYLRFNKTGTIKKIGWKLFLKITEAYYYYCYLNNLYSTSKYDYVIINHHCYIRSLLMVRIGILAGIKIIFQDSATTKKIYNMKDSADEHIHQPNIIIISKFFSDTSYINKLSQDKDVVLDRVAGIEYYDKNTTDNDFIIRLVKLKKTTGKKIVVIYAHAYLDNVTSSNGRKFIFRDHYLWIKNTLELCANNKHIITILKWHPGEKIYSADISTEAIFNEVQEELNNEYLLLSPKSIDFKKHSDIVDLVITSRGTIGVEMPCLGVPVLAQVKDNAVFSKTNIVIETENYEDYVANISKAHLIPKLTKKEINKAIAFAKLSNILVFYGNRNFFFHRDDVLREPGVLQNATDGPKSPEDIYREDIDDLVNDKIINFNKSHKSDFHNDMRLFLSDKNMKYLAEVNYEKKLQEIIDANAKT